MMGLADASVGDEIGVDRGVTRYGEGLDQADALHLASGMDADALVTSDRARVKKARRIGPVDVRLLQGGRN